MRFLKSVLLASSCLLSSVSAADSAGAPDDDHCKRATAAFTYFTPTEFSVKVSSSTIKYPFCLLKAPDDSWRLVIRKPSHEERPLMLLFEETKIRFADDRRELTPKLYLEILVMCSLVSECIWTLDAFKTSFLWGELWSGMHLGTFQ